MPIDYRLLGFQPTETGATQSPLETLGQMGQYRQQQAQLQQMQYQQQRQRSLADIARQTAGSYGDPTAQAYAQGGFGDQAQTIQAAAAARAHAQAQWMYDQQKRQTELAESAQKLDNIRRLHVASLLTSAKSQEDFDKIAAAAPDEYGLKPGDEFTAATKRFNASTITPEKAAEIAARPQYAFPVDPNTGRVYAGNKLTGQLGGGVGGMGGAQAPGGAPRPSPNLYAGMKPKDVNDQFNKFYEAVSDNNTRKLLGQNAQALQRAEALEALLHVPDLNTLTKQQVREAGTSLNGLIAKGGPQAVSQIEELVPSSLAADWSALKSKFNNKPEGAQAAAFLENMLDTAKREKQTTYAQQKRIREEALADFAPLRKVDQQRFDSIMKRVGMNPLAYDEHGNPLTGDAARLAHFKGQLQPGERLIVNDKGQAKAIGAGDAVPTGFKEVK